MKPVLFRRAAYFPLAWTGLYFTFGQTLSVCNCYVWTSFLRKFLWVELDLVSRKPTNVRRPGRPWRRDGIVDSAIWSSAMIDCIKCLTSRVKPWFLSWGLFAFSKFWIWWFIIWRAVTMLHCFLKQLNTGALQVEGVHRVWVIWDFQLDRRYVFWFYIWSFWCV